MDISIYKIDSDGRLLDDTVQQFSGLSSAQFSLLADLVDESIDYDWR